MPYPVTVWSWRRRMRPELLGDGEVLETRGPDGGPPYLVRWSDGHEGLFYPGPGALLRVGTSLGGGSSSEVPTPAVDSTVDLGEAHVREWHVRISIFERGDDTDANVVLLADAPQNLSAQGARPAQHRRHLRP